MSDHGQVSERVSAESPLARRSPHPVFWVIAGALVVIAVGQFSGTGDPLGRGVAFAQPVTSGGSRGVFAFSGQLTKGTFGVYMVDVDTMNLWAYEYLPQKECLRLAAARTWRYDRYLENHNLCGLPPEVVEQLIDEQREYRLRQAEDKAP